MKATPEQQKAGHGSLDGLGRQGGRDDRRHGGPLGKSLRVTPKEVSPIKNDLGGYSILQGESKEAVAETLKGHPHFMTPDGSLEIIETHARPGHVTQNRPARPTVLPDR